MNREETRPEPEELLRLAQREEAAKKKGRLTIYLGAAPGVGKTYAMLSDAQERRREGLDIVVGYVQTHGRAETDALAEGLETIPPIEVEYRGFALKEFDLEAALARKPQLMLVDELAHTNAPGVRHTKRYQDVEELLEAGIDVYTTVNVQHVETLNDIIGQIVGIKVHETVPDTLFDRAEDIKLIDLPPEELIRRLHEGKVYVKDIVGIAVEKYFRPGNLMALRELALRAVAGRVDEQMRQYMREYAVPGIWPANERVMVAVFASPNAEKLVRSSYRLASELDAELIAFHVETEQHKKFTDQETRWLNDALKLAERLGARVVWIKGSDVAGEIADYARKHNVTKLVVGKPRRRRFLPTLSSDILEKTPNIDIYMMDAGTAKMEFPAKPGEKLSAALSYLAAVAVLAVVVGIAFALRDVLNQVDLFLLLLAAPVISAIYFGRGPSVLVSVAGIVAFDYLFIPPYYSFSVSDLQYFVSFVIYFGIAVIVSNLAVGRREKLRLLHESETRNIALYGLSRNLISSRNVGQVLSVLIRKTQQLFPAEIAIFLPEEDHLMVGAKTDKFDITSHSMGVASWAYVNREMAGRGTSTLPESNALYIPMMYGEKIEGVMGVLAEGEQPFSPEQQVILDTVASLGAMALERVGVLGSRDAGPAKDATAGEG